MLGSSVHRSAAGRAFWARVRQPYRHTLTEIGAQQGGSAGEAENAGNPLDQERGTAPAPRHRWRRRLLAPGPSARRPAGTHSPTSIRISSGRIPGVAVFVRSGRVILAGRLDLSSEADADADGLSRGRRCLGRARRRAEALALVGYGAASLPTNRLLTQLMDRLVGRELIRCVVCRPRALVVAPTCARRLLPTCRYAARPTPLTRSPRRRFSPG